MKGTISRRKRAVFTRLRAAGCGCVPGQQYEDIHDRLGLSSRAPPERGFFFGLL